MATTYSSRELEWFDLETRMREILHEQLTPIIQKAKLDREAQAMLKASNEELLQRISQVEAFVFGEGKAETALNKVHQRIDQMEAQRKSDHVSLEQELLMNQERLKSFNFQLKGCQEMTQRLEGLHDTVTAEIQALKQLIETHQQLIVTEMKGLNTGFKEMNKTYTELAVKTEEKAQVAVNKAESNAMYLKNFNIEISSFRSEIEEVRHEIRSLHSTKHDITAFEQAETSLQNAIAQLKTKDLAILSEITERDSFLDKHYTLRVATIVSDALYASLDSQALHRFAEHEQRLLLTLNNVATSQTVDSREAAVDKILKTMNTVEQRKAEILARPATHLSSKPLNDVEPDTDLEKKLEPAQTLPDLDDKLENFMAETVRPALASLKSEWLKHLEALSKTCKFRSDESTILCQQLLSQLDEFDQRLKKERSELGSHTAETRGQLDEFHNELSSAQNFLSSMALMVVCLVENAQIHHALEAQDEKDRHATGQTLDKELQSERVGSRAKAREVSSVPSATFGLQKKCLSCQNPKSILTGVRTSLVYQPTPLYYRNHKFKRLELISLMGRMLESCWASVAEHMPWNKAEFESILNEASVVLKKSTFLKEPPRPPTQGSHPLPVLGQLRSKTPHTAQRRR